MAKVWIVEMILPYEGDINQAVFATEKAARKFAKKAMKNDLFRTEYAVTEWEVS